MSQLGHFTSSQRNFCYCDASICLFHIFVTPSSRRKWKPDNDTFFLHCHVWKKHQRRKWGAEGAFRLSPFLYQRRIYTPLLKYFPPHCQPAWTSAHLHFLCLFSVSFPSDCSKLAHNAPVVFFPLVVSVGTFYLSHFHCSSDVKFLSKIFPSKMTKTLVLFPVSFCFFLTEFCFKPFMENRL